MVMALNMMDEVRTNGGTFIDIPAAVEKMLGIPVRPDFGQQERGH